MKELLDELSMVLLPRGDRAGAQPAPVSLLPASLM